MATALIPIPSKDFDPTEVAVSWKVEAAWSLSCSPRPLAVREARTTSC